MLYKPDHRSAFSGVRPLLDCWNTEADYFRRMAQAARRGTAPPAGAVAAASDAQEGIIGLLDQIDQALAGLPAGHPDFRELLQAQITALSLRESIAHSLDVLDAYVPAPSGEARVIRHGERIIGFV
jgi:hypothetical protein